MLPDWPNHKLEYWRVIRQRLRVVTFGNAAVVAQLPSVISGESRRIEFVAADNSRQVMQLEAREASKQFDRNELLSAGPTVLADALQSLGRELGEDMEKSFFTKMSEADSKARRTFTAKSPQEAFNEFADGLRELEFDFEDDGTPSVFAAVSPEIGEMLRQADNPQNQAIIEEITEKKRNEWLDRESRRRLVD